MGLYVDPDPESDTSWNTIPILAALVTVNCTTHMRIDWDWDCDRDCGMSIVHPFSLVAANWDSWEDSNL